MIAFIFLLGGFQILGYCIRKLNRENKYFFWIILNVYIIIKYINHKFYEHNLLFIEELHSETENLGLLNPTDEPINP